MFYTYILKSETKGTYYYGSTENIEKRIHEHNAGKIRYTKSKRPWIIHYFETFPSQSEAMKREKFFKTIDGYLHLKRCKII